MSQIGITLARTTSIQMSDQLRSNLRRTQLDLADLQQQLSTGLHLARPSDEPGRTSAVLVLQEAIEARTQHQRNLTHGLGLLNNVDQSLADASAILIQAQSIASSQVGIGSDRDTREAEATVIDAQIRALVDIGNRQFQNISLFGGDLGAAEHGNVFVDLLGGVRYVGSTSNLQADVGHGGPLGVNLTGDAAFGALSTRVLGRVDIDPLATAQTRISDVRGAQRLGVRLGALLLNVDGTGINIDLAGADTLGDVATRVQAGIDSVDPAAGTLGLAGGGFELSAAGGHTITITDPSTGETAADLGLLLSATGSTVAGADLDPRLTARSTLADLGAPIDFASGMTVTHGGTTRLADFATAATVEDLANEINRLGVGLRLQINEAGTGLNLVSEVSGPSLSVSENGGTTAADLGLRTFGNDTRLEQFRFGLGVQTAAGLDDFEIRLHDGHAVAVNIDGLETVSQVLDAIAAAAAAAGLSVGAPGDAGTDLNVGIAPVGNGFQFEDLTTGAGDFRVVQLNRSLAATHLGIHADARADVSIQGDDRAMVRVESVLTHLMDLRDSLRNNDSFGITLAGEAVEDDIAELARVRAEVGGRARWIDDQQERSQDLKISEQSLLSDLRDAEYTEVVSRFLQMQQQMQASLQVGSLGLQNSLLDFLR